jgi:hypothetical protein
MPLFANVFDLSEKKKHAQATNFWQHDKNDL